MKPLPSDTFYRLNIDFDSVVIPAGQRWTDKTIRVAKFRASGVHRERAIAYSEHGGLLVKQHRYQLWIDSPERMLQNELVSYLRAIGAAPGVTGSESADAGFEIQGRIRRMDQVIEGDTLNATVVLAFELLERGGAQTLIFGREYRESRTVSSDDMRATISAISDSVTAIFERFVGDAGDALRN
jgi:ABC-type uncharacterized transport system auxiliary subunit